jgi:hypothetical protein
MVIPNAYFSRTTLIESLIRVAPSAMSGNNA